MIGPSESQVRWRDSKVFPFADSTNNADQEEIYFRYVVFATQLETFFF